MKTPIRIAVFVCLWFWVTGIGWAQSGSISGKISDENGHPIPFAKVEVEKAKPVALTDSAGKFTLSQVSQGQNSLLVTAPGFKIFKKTIQVTSEAEFFSIVLPVQFKNLEAVEVSSSENIHKTHLKSVDRFGIYEGRKSEVIDIKNLTANLATNNPRQVYGKITGLNIWESDGAGLQLGIGGRGLSPNRTANFNVRQNGYDISADALGYPESYYTPPVEALEKIEIVRGAASLQYGTQFGGLLNFQFKRGPENQKMSITSRQSVGSWGFFNSFTSVGGTIADKKLNYYGYAQYKRGDGFRPHSAFDYGNAYFAIDFQVNDRLLLELDLTKMTYQAQQPGGLTDKNFQDNPRQSIRSRNWFSVDWNLMAVMATYRISHKTQINMRQFGLLANRKSLGNLERINVADLGGNRTLIEGDFANIGTETRLLHRYSIADQNHTFLSGIRLYRGSTTARQGFASDGSGPDFRMLNPGNSENSDYRFPNTNLAAFAENIFQLSEKLSFTPGIRWEQITTASKGHYNIRTTDGAGNLVAVKKVEEQIQRSRSFFIAGLGISWKPDSMVEWYGNFSQNYRAINFSDLRVVNPNFVVDTNIRDEKGFTADLGIRGRIWNRLQYEVTAFYLFYEGKIGQILRADQPPLYNDYRFRGNISNARNLGLECFAEWELFTWHKPLKPIEETWKMAVFTNFAWVDSRYIQTRDAAIRNKKVEMVPPYMLRTGLNLKKKKMGLSIQYAWVGQHFSDATNAIRTATAVEGIIPGYQVVDISARYGWERFFVEVSVNNLLNASYFTRRADSYPGPGIIPADGRGWYATLGFRF